MIGSKERKKTLPPAQSWHVASQRNLAFSSLAQILTAVTSAAQLSSMSPQVLPLPSGRGMGVVYGS